MKFIKYQKDGSSFWKVDVTVSGKRRRPQGFKTKHEAQQFVAKLIDDERFRKFHLKKKKDRKLFKDFAKDYLKHHSQHKKSYKSECSHMEHLVKFFGEFDLTQFSLNAMKLVNEYKQKRLNSISARGRKVSTTTVNRELALLKNMLSKAEEYNLIEANPLWHKNIRYREAPREKVLPINELQNLLDSADSPLKEIITVALNTGMRKGEILKLEWVQVNLEEEFITTESKTGKIRNIPMNEKLLKLLAQLSLKRKHQRYVFENPQTRKPYTDVKTAWYGLLKRLKIEGFRFHDLRHCFATYAFVKRHVSLRGSAAHTFTSLGYKKGLVVM